MWRTIEKFPEYSCTIDGKLKKDILRVNGNIETKYIKPYKSVVGALLVKLYEPNCEVKTMRLAELVYNTWKDESAEKKIIGYKDNNKENCHADNLYLMSKVRKDIRYYIPVSDYHSKMGYTMTEPQSIILSQNRTQISTLEDPQFQAKKAEEIFDFIFSYTPHGIFTKLADRFNKHIQLMQEMGLKDFDMNKYNKPNPELNKIMQGETK